MKISLPEYAPVRHRFVAKTRAGLVEKKPGIGPCLLWTGALRNGYGHFTVRVGFQEYTHRLAFFFDRWRWPKHGLDVRHLCDERRCVRPSHLAEGTRTQNMADAVAQGRHAHGETHGLARLTDAQVRAIRIRRTNGEKSKNLAVEFRITRGYVDSLCRSSKYRRTA